MTQSQAKYLIILILALSYLIYGLGRDLLGLSIFYSINLDGAVYVQTGVLLLIYFKLIKKDEPKA